MSLDARHTERACRILTGRGLPGKGGRTRSRERARSPSPPPPAPTPAATPLRRYRAAAESKALSVPERSERVEHSATAQSERAWRIMFGSGKQRGQRTVKHWGAVTDTPEGAGGEFQARRRLTDHERSVLSGEKKWSGRSAPDLGRSPSPPPSLAKTILRKKPAVPALTLPSHNADVQDGRGDADLVSSDPFWAFKERALPRACDPLVPGLTSLWRVVAAPSSPRLRRFATQEIFDFDDDSSDDEPSHGPRGATGALLRTGSRSVVESPTGTQWQAMTLSAEQSGRAMEIMFSPRSRAARRGHDGGWSEESEGVRQQRAALRGKREALRQAHTLQESYGPSP